MKESKKDEEKKIEYFFENVWPYIYLVIMGILFFVEDFSFYFSFNERGRMSAINIGYTFFGHNNNSIVIRNF